ncbi:LEA type 2 family protein [Chitinophaga sp. GCM10012297]|uniref:LEA type 2 family protein n=1 Tax=Chitinophaga chungangae TaxID=2821488 RepID=A0ABS3Y9Z3_9BACT|nr:LEA type 2 family protein [Chitinophaga chungangae]MBO9151451.1 LEA type 2 family protein [Chitinophaga chungangae]
MKRFRWCLVILFIWGGLSSCDKMKDLEFLRVASFDFESLSFSKSTVKMELAYFNPNNFSLRLKDAEFDVFLDDTKVGHSLQDTLIDIPARDTFYFPVKLDVEMGNVFKNVLGALGNKEVTIKASGNCKVGKKGVYLPFPIRCETKQKLDFF